MADTLLDSDWQGFINSVNTDRRMKSLPNVVFLSGPEVDTVDFKGKSVKVKEYDVRVQFGGTSFVPSPTLESVTQSLNQIDIEQVAKRTGNFLVTIRDWNFVSNHKYLRTEVFTRYSVTPI